MLTHCHGLLTGPLQILRLSWKASHTTPHPLSRQSAQTITPAQLASYFSRFSWFLFFSQFTKCPSDFSIWQKTLWFKIIKIKIIKKSPLDHLTKIFPMHSHSEWPWLSQSRIPWDFTIQVLIKNKRQSLWLTDTQYLIGHHRISFVFFLFFYSPFI